MNRGEAKSPWREPAICVALAVVTFALYARVAGHPFVSFDDNRYVYENAQVKRGLSLRGIGWAFTALQASNWHPLTWLSHMLDVQIFGLAAGPHHLVNVALHAANAVLVYAVLRRMTGAAGRSLLVAALFAVHPLHVESVAWVAERKDLLSTLFGLLALWGWTRHVESPALRRYALAGLFFAMSLLAKPMWVTFPALLLVLDFWPYRRRLRAVEKLPLVALSAASCVATLVAQRGAMTDLSLPLGLRLANATVGYARYLIGAFWPWPLALHHPYPQDGLPAWQIAGAVALLAGVSGGAVVARRRAPWLLVGWLWFVGTLVPVIGIVQVGTQAIADRYTYVPLLGIFIAVAWSAVEVAPRFRTALAAAAAIAVVALAGLTWRQIGYWSDSEKLFRHSLAVAPGDATMHAALSDFLRHAGRMDEALEHQRAATQFDPHGPATWNNLAALEAEMGRFDEAIRDVHRALVEDPAYGRGWDNLGHFELRRGNLEGAAAALERAIRFAPRDSLAHEHFASALVRLGHPDEALGELSEAVRLDGENVSAWTALGMLQQSQGRGRDAVEAFRAATRARPSNPLVWRNLGVSLAMDGRFAEAAAAFVEALRLKPGDADVLHRLGVARAAQGDRGSALAIAAQLEAIDPARAADLRSRTQP